MVKLTLVTQDLYDAVNQDVRDELDLLSEFIKEDLYVTSAFRPGDPREHGERLAVDVICPTMNLFDFFIASQRFIFSGIGIYPDWKFNGNKVGGLHLDMRTAKFRAIWMGVMTDSGQKYIELDKENLKAHGVLA